MTEQEACRCCCIPADVTRIYKSWKTGTGAGRTAGGSGDDSGASDDCDLKCLSLITTLYSIGFAPDEIKTYLDLLYSTSGGRKQRLHMLDARRRELLDKIHSLEKDLVRLDDLRYSIRRNRETI